MVEGYSVRKSAKVCGIGSSTSFRWRHRFLRLPAEMKPEALNGIAEADETFMLGSRKGERELPRKPRKRGGKAGRPKNLDTPIQMTICCISIAILATLRMPTLTGMALWHAVEGPIGPLLHVASILYESLLIPIGISLAGKPGKGTWLADRHF